MANGVHIQVRIVAKKYQQRDELTGKGSDIDRASQFTTDILHAVDDLALAHEREVDRQTMHAIILCVVLATQSLF